MLVLLSIGSTTTSANYFFQAARTTTWASEMVPQRGRQLSYRMAGFRLAITDEHTTRIFVVNQSTPAVSVLDARTGATIISQGSAPISNASITTSPSSIGVGPHAVAVDAQTGIVLIANAHDDTVSVLDAKQGTLLGAIAVGDGPVAIAVDEADHRALIINSTSHSVSILNTMLVNA